MIKKLIKLAVGLSILSLLIILAGPTRVIRGVNEVGVIPFFFAVFLYFLGQLVCSVKWKIIAESVEIKKPFWEYVIFYLSGMFLNIFLPTSVGGDVGRAYFLTGQKGWQKGFATVLAERYTGFVALSLFLSWGVYHGGGFLPESARKVFILLPIPVIGGALFFLFGGKQLLGKILPGKVEVFDHFYEILRKAGILAISFFISILFYLFYIWMHHVVAAALGFAVPFSTLTAIVTMTSIVSMIPISLGGLGIREGSYFYFLTLFGISQHMGVAFGVTILAVNLFLSLSGGILIYVFKVYSKKEEE
jgi:uncharacterized membrane protein YbhN (UPF0104 family)